MSKGSQIEPLRSAQKKSGNKIPVLTGNLMSPDFFIYYFLFKPIHSVLLSRRRARYISVYISDRAVADAFPVSLYAEFFQYEFVLRQPEFLLGSVDPDAAKSE